MNENEKDLGIPDALVDERLIRQLGELIDQQAVLSPEVRKRLEDRVGIEVERQQGPSTGALAVIGVATLSIAALSAGSGGRSLWIVLAGVAAVAYASFVVPTLFKKG